MLGLKWSCEVRCIKNCPYNDIAKGNRLHDKIAIFVYTGKIHTSKSFWKQNLLTIIRILHEYEDNHNILPYIVL